MRVLISGGGTVGHVSPALATAQALVVSDASVELLYVGSAGGLEAEVVPAEGVPFAAVTTRPWRARPAEALAFATGVPLGILQARRLMARFRPQVVLGTGGYVCFPVILAARSRRTPYVLLEANVVPGRTVRILSRAAAAVATSFAGTAAQLPGAHTVLTGNPVRAEFTTLQPRPAGEAPPYVLLVTGGSQGARRLNLAVADALPRLLEQAPLSVIHLCGPLDLPELQARRERLGPTLAERWELSAFRSDMASLIARSDLAVCRAGGSTAAELLALGRPGIYVPYPRAGAHQAQNAEAVVAGGAGLLLRDEECDGERMLSEVLNLLRNPQRLHEMASSARSLGRPHAAAELAGLLRQVASEGKVA